VRNAMTADSKNNPIDLEACEWATRIASGSMSPAEQVALEDWLASDARHRGAFIRAQAASVHVDRISALSPPSGTLSRGERGRPPGAGEGLTRRSLLAAGLAALAIGATGGAFWLWHRRGEVYETNLGEVRRITLSDGSSMLLDSATVAHVRFDEHYRDIELLRGQGLFEVTKDSARPFIVHARDVSVRAVGTVFAVRAVDRNVAVTVTEGVVEVADSSASGSTIPQRVAAEERAVVDDTRTIQVQPVTEAQVERHLAWRDGMLNFDGESLADAVAEINRHNQRQIVVDDPTLASRPVIGIFRASDTEGFAQTVATALGAQVASDGDTLHLNPRSAR
jgi:transmembrane sensor